MAKEESGRLGQAMIDYLDCPCRYFESMNDDDVLMEAFREAQQRGREQGFTPVIVAACDDVLMECLAVSVLGAENVSEDYQIDVEAARAYRRDLLSTAQADGTDALHRMMALREEECADSGIDLGFDGALADSADVPECEDRFYGYWDFASGKTMPLIIAEIPTDKPWEIFAWLPFGGWNECPDTADLMAVSKSWYERFGAVPSVITHDTLDYELPRPVSVLDAMRAAKEQFAFCPDVIYSAADECTAGMLAASLLKSRFWSFWWD